MMTAGAGFGKGIAAPACKDEQRCELSLSEIRSIRPTASINLEQDISLRFNNASTLIGLVDVNVDSFLM